MNLASVKSGRKFGLISSPMRQGQPSNNACDRPATHMHTHRVQRQSNATAERSTFLPPQGTQPPLMLWLAWHKANFLPMPMARACLFPRFSKFALLHEKSLPYQ